PAQRLANPRPRPRRQRTRRLYPRRRRFHRRPRRPPRHLVHHPRRSLPPAPMLRFYPHHQAKKMRLEPYREAWHLLQSEDSPCGLEIHAMADETFYPENTHVGTIAPGCEEVHVGTAASSCE